MQRKWYVCSNFSMMYEGLKVACVCVRERGYVFREAVLCDKSIPSLRMIACQC